jgi:hypothetical protein
MQSSTNDANELSLADKAKNGDEATMDQTAGDLGLDEIVASPNVEAESSVDGDADNNAKSIVRDTLSNEKDAKYSTPQRRSRTSFQSPLDDIVEVESLASNDGEDVPVEVDGAKQSMNLKQHSNSSMNSWDKEDNETVKSTVECATKEEERPDTKTTVAVTDDGKDELKSVETAPLSSNTNRSFEERMSLLHAKMETQLIDKLHQLEEKISQSQQHKIDASEEEAVQLKKELSESTTTVMQLRTDIATKDLEILRIKQRIVHLEANLEESLAKLATSFANVGDGELNPDKPALDDQEVLSEKVNLEKELSAARDEIVSLQKQAAKTSNLLADAEEQLKETQQRLQAAEQLAIEEKASAASMMLLLEQKSNDSDRVDRALMLKLSEEKERSDMALKKLREELTRVQEVAHCEVKSMRNEKEECEQQMLVEKTRACNLEDQLANAVASHKASLMELKVNHDKEINETRSQLMQSHKDELRMIQGQLKEEQLSRLELEIASNEANKVKELAVEKANYAEAELKRMTEMINESRDLRVLNDKLYSSLHAETEKRKILHNTIEDMKGVWFSYLLFFT